ncbi:MAG: MFS transporter, partial [Paraburkholderia sp.]
RWAVALLVLAGLGIGASGLMHSAAFGLVALCCAASGFIAAQPLFWTFPTRYLTGAAAAGGIALINSLGGIGGFIAPTLRTSAEHAFASTSAGLLALGAASLLAALLIGTLFRRDSTPAADSITPLIHRAR